MQTHERILHIYEQNNGKSPFEDWIQNLRDKTAKAIIFQRIDRLRLGNFGNCQSVGSGVHELKISWGPGFRVYFGLDGINIIVLLCGGDKSTQKEDIQKAYKMWGEFKNETKKL